MKVKVLKIRVRFIEEILGTGSANKEIHEEFIASKAPDAPSRAEEVAAIGADEVFEKGMTVFAKDENGRPFAWDYQWLGFFKDAIGGLRDVPGTACSKMKAYKKKIDHHIKVYPRKIPIEFEGETGICQRPLRAQTAQGERVALSSSESIPAGATMIFEIAMKVPDEEPVIRECLNNGKDRGFGQWRNSGKGAFKWKLLEEYEREEEDNHDGNDDEE
jgi:hypothetical protein